MPSGLGLLETNRSVRASCAGSVCGVRLRRALYSLRGAGLDCTMLEHFRSFFYRGLFGAT